MCSVRVYLCPHRVTGEGSSTSRISRIYRNRRRGAADNIHPTEIVIYREIKILNLCAGTIYLLDPAVIAAMGYGGRSMNVVAQPGRSLPII